jgi:hypothetical protein
VSFVSFVLIQRRYKQMESALARLFTMRVAFTPADFDAGRRSMECHKTQTAQEAVDRVIPAMRDAWNGEIPLSPMVPQVAGKDLFQ